MSEFNVYYRFFRECDENGSPTWFISNKKTCLYYYYNDNNFDVKEKLNRLNITESNFELSQNG